MTITKKNNAEGGTNGTAVSTGNSGGTSGDAWTLLSSPSGSIIYDTASAVHGSLGYKFTPASGQQCLARWTGFSDTSGVMRDYVTIDTLPASGVEAIFSANTSTGGGVIAVSVSSAGKYVLTDSTGTSISGTLTTASYAAGDRIELWWIVGTTNANGQFSFALYRADATSATETKSGSTANLSNSGANTLWDRAIFGKSSGSTWAGVMHMDDMAAASGTTTFFGVPAQPPTAAFSTTIVGTDVICDSSASAPVSPATITSKAWTFGDGGTATGDSPTHQYAAAGTYSIGLTVTDSNGQTGSVSHSVTIAALGTSAAMSAATLATSTSPAVLATVLANLNDTSSGSPVLTTWVAMPDTSTFTVKFAPIAAPQTNQPAIWPLIMDRVQSSTGTITAKLYQGDPAAGGTLRSSVPLTVPDVTASGGSGDASTGAVGSNQMLLAQWPWSDVQNVTDWNQMYATLTAATS